MATTITNSNLDTLAAAVPAPYGPLTRVTSVASLPTPNSEIRIEFTSQYSISVWLTYEELQVAGVRDRILAQAHEWTDVVTNMKTHITALDALADGMSAPHTYADYQTLVDYIRENFPWTRGVI